MRPDAIPASPLRWGGFRRGARVLLSAALRSHLGGLVSTWRPTRLLPQVRGPEGRLSEAVEEVRQGQSLHICTSTSAAKATPRPSVSMNYFGKSEEDLCKLSYGPFKMEDFHEKRGEACLGDACRRACPPETKALSSPTWSPPLPVLRCSRASHSRRLGRP